AAILDLSSAVYAAFEPRGPRAYRGLPPRLATEVFRAPDERGRLPRLGDEWAETVSVGPAGVALAAGADAATLRAEAVPDLVALQAAAAREGAPFWVVSGYRAPPESGTPAVLE